MTQLSLTLASCPLFLCFGGPGLTVPHTGRSLVYKQKLTSYQTVILIELFLFVIQRFPPQKKTKKFISLLDLGVSLVDVGVIRGTQELTV